MVQVNLDQYTDSELEKLPYSELEKLTGNTGVSISLIKVRITRGWSRRRAVSEGLTPKGKKPSKNHPYRKFTSSFYSKRNKTKAEELERKWNNG